MTTLASPRVAAGDVSSSAIFVSSGERTGDWSGTRGSNPRPRAWEARALPTELVPRTTAAFYFRAACCASSEAPPRKNRKAQPAGWRLSSKRLGPVFPRSSRIFWTSARTSKGLPMKASTRQSPACSENEACAERMMTGAYRRARANGGAPPSRWSSASSGPKARDPVATIPARPRPPHRRLPSRRRSLRARGSRRASPRYPGRHRRREHETCGSFRHRSSAPRPAAT